MPAHKMIGKEYLHIEDMVSSHPNMSICKVPILHI